MGASQAKETEEEFGYWLNTHLKARGYVVSDLVNDLSDGVVILELIHQWKICEVGAFSQREGSAPMVTGSQERKENINRVCDILNKEARKRKASVTFNAEDLFARGLIDSMWALVGLSCGPDVPMERKSLKKFLLKWSNAELNKYGVSVSNFHQSWADGKALDILLSKTTRGQTIGKHIEQDNTDTGKGSLHPTAQTLPYFGLSCEFKKQNQTEHETDNTPAKPVSMESIIENDSKTTPANQVDTSDAHALAIEDSGAQANAIDSDNAGQQEGFSPKSSILQNGKYTREIIWQPVLNDRVLRIFMSSTFRDMQRERDTFFQFGEHRVKEFAKKRGVILVFIDLRWGLTGEISSNGLVVISCLESIEKCPYFLCTLGARYGWVPDSTNPSEWHPTTDSRYPFLEAMRGLSVTEYEIQYGSLLDKPVSRRAFFFARDEEYAVLNVAKTEAEKILYRPVNEKDGENQAILKQKISSKFHITTYQEPKELCDYIIASLEYAISSDFPLEEKLDEEDLAHNQVMKHRLTGFEGRADLLKQLSIRVSNQLESDDTGITVIGAQPGIGKSSVMAALIRNLSSERQQNHILFHFVGASHLSIYAENIIRRFVDVLSNKGMLPSSKSTEGEEIMKRGFVGIMDHITKTSNGNVIFVIDGVNQLVNSELYPTVGLLHWIPKKTPKNFAIVISSISDHHTCDILKSNGAEIVPVSKLTEDEIEEASVSFMAKYDKTLSEPQTETIRKNSEQTGHPLYLRTMLDEIRVFGVYESIDSELQKLTSFESVTTLFNFVLQRWEMKYGPEMVRIIMSVLCISRIGLSEEELDKYVQYRLEKEIGQENIAIWKSFLFKLMESLCLRNGRYIIFHQLLVGTAKARYLNEEMKQNEMREYGLWLLHLYEGQNLDAETTAEICHTLLSAREFTTLADYLKMPYVVSHMLSGQYRYEFIPAWRALVQEGFDPKESYVARVQDITEESRLLIEYFLEIQQYSFLNEIINTRLSKTCDEETKRSDLFIHGRVLQNMGLFARALDEQTKALEIASRLYGEESIQSADSIRLIAITLSSLARYDEALEKQKKAMTIYMAIHGELHSTNANSNHTIATIRFNQGEYYDALDYAMKSLDTRTKLFGEQHPDIAQSYNFIGVTKTALAEWEGAMENHKKSLKTYMAIFGEYHGRVADCYCSMATIACDIANTVMTGFERHRMEDAIEMYQKALAIRIHIFGETHPDVALSWNNLATAYEKGGNLEKALELFEKGLEIRLRFFNKEHPDIANSYNNIATTYRSMEKFDEAIKYYNLCMDINCKVLSADHFDIALCHYNMADTYEKQSKNKEAFESYKKAKEIWETKFGPSYPYAQFASYGIQRLQFLVD